MRDAVKTVAIINLQLKYIYNMVNNFKKMAAKAVAIRKRYSKFDRKEWRIEQVFMGLVKDVGDLSKVLMIYNGYRDDLNKKTESMIGHELADMLYSIMVIANKIGINLEKSFWDNMKNIESKLKDK